jgi:TBCC domain-containing protein 1
MASDFHSHPGKPLYGLEPAPSLDGTNNDDDDRSVTGGIRLTAKPHAFAGAVLSPKHATELTPSLCLAIASALAEQSHRPNKVVVPYTLWITEAWRVLGWAEPSAALFWEMATMYHTLLIAGRAFAADWTDPSSAIPPILSCGSTSSMGSGTNSHSDRPAIDKKKYSSAASAKELPVWLVGTFLLLHCEEFAYQRNLSGQDERRFYSGESSLGSSVVDPLAGGKMDFTSLFKYPSLSPRYVASCCEKEKFNVAIPFHPLNDCSFLYFIDQHSSPCGMEQ